MWRGLIILLALGLQPLAWGSEAVHTVAELVQELNAQPTLPNEGEVEKLLNNSAFQSALAKSPDELQPLLESMNYDQARTVVLKKQQLGGEILKQAVLEFKDPEELERLIIHGQYSKSQSVVSVSHISNIQTIFELLFLLLQREEEVQRLALEILKQKGPIYPSDHSFAVGMARYTAKAAAKGSNEFDQILELTDNLYAVLERHPHRPENPRDRYFVYSFADELASLATVPGFMTPEATSTIVKNLFSQIRKRKPETVHAGRRVWVDLTKAIAVMSNHAEANAYVNKVLKDSLNPMEIEAVLQGLYRQSDDIRDKAFYEMIYNSIYRLRPSGDNDQQYASFLSTATHNFTRFFRGNHDQVPPNTANHLRRLYSHPNAIVRRDAVSSLGYWRFDPPFHNAQLRSFLEDRDESVRNAAVGYLDYGLEPAEAVAFNGSLVKLITSDPDQGVREHAAFVWKQISRGLDRGSTPDTSVNSCGKVLGPQSSARKGH